MKSEQIVGGVQALARRVSEEVSSTRWYLFGSAVDNPINCADIDVVVICASHEFADTIRRLADQEEFFKPLHLLILTELEEAEICVVSSNRYIKIF